MDTITVNNHDIFLKTIKREEMTTKNALDFFERAFDVKIITLVDAGSNELYTDKDTVVKTIQDWLIEVKRGNKPNRVLFFS